MMANSEMAVAWKGKIVRPDGAIYEGEFKIWRCMERENRFDLMELLLMKATSKMASVMERENRGDLMEPFMKASSKMTRHGKGKWAQPNGITYEGDFQTGEWHGKGKWTGPNGTTYEGAWVNGKRL